MNYWAILPAAILPFILGGLWYSPSVFGKAWQREVGLSSEQLQSANPAKVFGLSLILNLMAAAVFGMFLGPSPALGFAIGAGFSAGLCWVAAAFGINYLFAQRSLKLFLIDGGYHTLQFTIIGAVFGAWH